MPQMVPMITPAQSGATCRLQDGLRHTTPTELFNRTQEEHHESDREHRADTFRRDWRNERA